MTKHGILIENKDVSEKSQFQVGGRMNKGELVEKVVKECALGKAVADRCSPVFLVQLLMLWQQATR